MKLCPVCEAEYGDEVTQCPNDAETLVFLRERTDDLAGQVFSGRYRLLEKVGEGGMGAVYRGTQEPMGREVAVKVLRSDLASDKEVVRRFFNEARVVSRLRHPNTVTLYDFGQSERGDLFIAMEFMAGLSLSSTLEARHLELAEILEITDQVCLALEEAHDSGIVHRDLKPDNIFIDRVGSRHMVKVLDFGIAKVPDAAAHLTRTGTVFGTPAYMSPEQAQAHHVDHRSDIYTLGIVLYEMLAGAPPFTADNPMQVALKQVTARPAPIMDMSRVRPLPRLLSALVMDMLEKDPSRRPQTIGEVRERIIRLAQAAPGVTVEGGEDETAVVRIGDPTDTMPEAWRGYTPSQNAVDSGAVEAGRTEIDFSLRRSSAPTVRAASTDPPTRKPTVRATHAAPEEFDPEQTFPPVKRGKRAWALAAFALLGVGFAVALLLSREETPPRRTTQTPTEAAEDSATTVGVDVEDNDSEVAAVGAEGAQAGAGEDATETSSEDGLQLVVGSDPMTSENVAGDADETASVEPESALEVAEPQSTHTDRSRRNGSARAREDDARGGDGGATEETAERPRIVPLIGDLDPEERSIVPIDGTVEAEQPDRPTLLAPIVTPTSP